MPGPIRRPKKDPRLDPVALVTSTVRGAEKASNIERPAPRGTFLEQPIPVMPWRSCAEQPIPVMPAKAGI